MYLSHFGMRESPFGLTPNTRFYVNLPTHHRALNVILVALRSGEGFIKVIGEVGTGKTLLCRKLLRLLGSDPNGPFVTAYLPDPFLSPEGLRRAVAEELGIPFPARVDSQELLVLIREVLVDLHREGQRVVLLIDEAQALRRDSLESLRLLTNLETETSKLLQVILFGQPELDSRLELPSLRQLAQRIAFSYRLQPMDRGGLSGYVSERLTNAGYSGDSLFTPPAMAALHRASAGVPRVVNILCHKALMSAYGEGASAIRRRHVRRAVADFDARASMTAAPRTGWLRRSIGRSRWIAR